MDTWVFLGALLQRLADGTVSISEFRSHLAELRAGLGAVNDYITLLPLSDVPFSQFLLRCQAEIGPGERGVGELARALSARVRRFVEGLEYFRTGAMIGGDHSSVVPEWAAGVDIDRARSLLDLLRPIDTGVTTLNANQMSEVLTLYRALQPVSFLNILSIQLCEAVLDSSSLDQPVDLQDMAEFIEQRDEFAYGSSELERIKMCWERLQGRRAVCLSVFAAAHIPTTVVIEDVENLEATAASRH